jgi:DNA-binding transcriptional LysR family regulator
MLIARPDDLSLIDVKLLRLFEAIHATRSVTRAAELLNLSQPTISIGLGKLRDRYGDRLFVRSPDGMVPTPLADTLIGAVRDALEALRRVGTLTLGFEPATASRRFRIAMTDNSHITLLPRILSQVRRRAPKCQLEATRIDAGLPEAMQSGAVDLALGFIPGLDADFYQQTLFSQDWVCLANIDHPGLTQGLTLEGYASSDHISIVAGTGQSLLEEAVARSAVKRTIALQLPSFLGLATILASSDLMATLPRQIGATLAALGGLKVHSCPFPIAPFDVKQHWHARYHNDAGNRWLRSLCAELFLDRV